MYLSNCGVGLYHENLKTEDASSCTPGFECHLTKSLNVSGFSTLSTPPQSDFMSVDSVLITFNHMGLDIEKTIPCDWKLFDEQVVKITTLREVTLGFRSEEELRFFEKERGSTFTHLKCLPEKVPFKFMYRRDERWHKPSTSAASGLSS